MKLYNVKANDTETIIEIQLAGIPKEDISVQVVREMLEVKSTPTEVETDYEYITRWFTPTKIDMKWELPNYISTKSIKSTCVDGILAITLPYKKESYKEIEIE